MRGLTARSPKELATMAVIALLSPVAVAAQTRTVIATPKTAAISSEARVQPSRSLVAPTQQVVQSVAVQVSTAAVQPVLQAPVPVVVLPDGRIFANLGFGFEEVVQACYNVLDLQPSTSALTIPLQPVVTQPLPGMSTATGNVPFAVAPSEVPQAGLQTPKTCWANRAGVVYVFRR